MPIIHAMEREFEDVRSEDTLRHLRFPGQRVTLCGKPVTERPIDNPPSCPTCRAKRREIIKTESE